MTPVRRSETADEREVRETRRTRATATKGENEGGDLGREGRTENDDRKRGAERRPGGKAEDVFVDEGILEHRLERRSGNREGRPDRQPEEEAGEPDSEQDVPLRPG